MSLLAVDMGSSSCKAVAFSEDGRVLSQKTYSYPAAQSPKASWAEMPADIFWEALRSVTREVSVETAKDPVEALAISSHGETFVAVDPGGRALAPAILNYDNRAVAESEWLAETLGPRAIFDTTGLTVHPMYPAAKLLWLRRNRPEVFSSAVRFLAVPDYLLTRLGLSPVIDYSLASRFLMFDIGKQSSSDQILSTCDVSRQQLSQPVPAGSVAGELSECAATKLGVRPGTLVVVGGHDQPCAALGSGVIGPGRISASLGTYECLVAASKVPALNDCAFACNLNSYCHVVPQHYVTLAYFPAGIMVEWFLRLIQPDGEAHSATLSSELFAALEAAAPEQPTGLHITPHLLGTCNPDFNPAASGVIAGIRPSTRRADIYKGILEGIACEFAQMAEVLKQAAGKFSDIYVSGGGVRSRVGLNLRAAFAGCELHLLQCQEAVCVGTAILAGVGAGKFRSIEEAVGQFVRVAESVSPDPGISERYKEQAAQYRVLYASLAPMRRAQTSCD